MAMQASQNNKTYPFIQGGTALVYENETILRDASRVAGHDIAQYTVMAQVAASEKWVPWSSVTNTDGSAIPAGILMNDGGVSGASVIAGDVTGVQILIGTAVEIDGGQLVFDAYVAGGSSALALTTAFSGNAAGSGTATPYVVLTCKALLKMLGIYTKTAYAASKTA